LMLIIPVRIAELTLEEILCLLLVVEPVEPAFYARNK